MKKFFRTRMNPDWYHGHGRQGPFFEGWYFKIINGAEDRRYAIIPGVFINPDPDKTHAFIQVLDGMQGTAVYHSYPFEAFRAVPEAFDVQIGNSRFRRDCIELDIDDTQGRLQGRLQFDGLCPWPVTATSPGIMGWYGWIPFMECNHGVVSLDHSISGGLEINGERVDFTGGRGYIEKDWGQNFPSGYIWQQSNHFGTDGTSLTASIAVIPNLGRSFAGFIIGLWHEGHLYRFATYTRARTERLKVSEEQVEWVVADRKYRLEMRSVRAEGGPLRGPEKTAMHMRVDETMKSLIEVRLSLLDGTLVYTGTGRNAALEVVGQLDMLLKP